MTRMNKIGIGIIGVAVAAGVVLGVFGFLQGFRQSQDAVSAEAVTAFQDELISRALARGPQPIEGFDASMFLNIFPGLEERDFDGVETGIQQGEGVYMIVDGALTWERTADRPTTSAERTIADAGYGTLLGNLSQRLALPASSAEEVIAIVDAIDVPADVAEHIASKRDMIVLRAPKPLTHVSTPVMVRGEARGSWYFEASFPVRIVDANGTVLGEHFATAQGEWMTEEFVPFTATVSFTTPTTATGTLILEKDNPSGLPEHADALRIPVRFMADEARQRTVQLYYYNARNDTDASGNIMCSAQGLVPVKRTIPITQTPIQDTIRLLLRGKLTPQEEALGVTTEFPLEGVELTGASLADGVLTLSFADPLQRTSGGSCRAGILWHQIRATAEQFEAVERVRFQPEELFQP